jgi:hypothetical protein
MLRRRTVRRMALDIDGAVTGMGVLRVNMADGSGVRARRRHTAQFGRRLSPLYLSAGDWHNFGPGLSHC